MVITWQSWSASLSCRNTLAHHIASEDKEARLTEVDGSVYAPEAPGRKPCKVLRGISHIVWETDEPAFQLERQGLYADFQGGSFKSFFDAPPVEIIDLCQHPVQLDHLRQERRSKRGRALGHFNGKAARQ